MKKAFYISLSLNIAVLLFFGGKRIYYSYISSHLVKPQPVQPTPVRWVDMWNKTRINVFSQMHIDTGDIVFVGNSLTEYFPLNEMFPGARIKNRGISGNETWHVAGRISNITRDHPAKIFLEIGINDFNNGRSVDTTFADYLKIVETIKKETPTTTLYIQSVMPTCSEYFDRMPKVIELNRRLQAFCLRESIRYIDLYTPMLAVDRLDSTLTGDGIHLNAKGYAVWKEQIKGFVERPSNSGMASSRR